MVYTRWYYLVGAGYNSADILEVLTHVDILSAKFIFIFLIN